jgi:hypothetical protein
MTLVHSPPAHTQPGSAKTVADILTAAADLIAKPGAWTQGTFARTENGKNTGWKEDDAECFCVAGAILRVGGAGHLNRAWNVFDDWTRSKGFRHLAGWNDDPKRTQEEVVAALRAVAEKATTANSVGTETQSVEVHHETGDQP